MQPTSSTSAQHRSYLLARSARFGSNSMKASKKSCCLNLDILCLLPAFHPGVNFLEGVDRRRAHSGAVRNKLLVLLLTFWPVALASPIGCKLKHLLLANAEQIHALLREQIFPHWSIFASMNANLPRNF